MFSTQSGFFICFNHGSAFSILVSNQATKESSPDLNQLEAAIQAMHTTVKEPTPPPVQPAPVPVVTTPPPAPAPVVQQQQQEFIQHKTESYTTVTSQTFESQKQQHQQSVSTVQRSMSPVWDNVIGYPTNNFVCIVTTLPLACW